MINLNLLGEFELLTDNRRVISLSTRKSEILFAYLSLNCGKSHKRERLYNLLWSDRSENQARNSLRQALSAIRKGLPSSIGGSLVTDRVAVLLPSNICTIDITQFEELVDKATLDSLSRAKDLYRGPFLEGIEIRDPAAEEWITLQRKLYKQKAIDAFLSLTELQRSAKDYKNAIDTAEALINLDIVNERAWRALILCHLDNNDRTHALTSFQRCKNILQRELGVEPGIEIQELYQTIHSAKEARKEPDSSFLSFPDKPSIVVLPLKNISSDPEQEYFSDGLTTDLITRLSRFRDLFIIANDSSFAYKGRLPRIGDVSRELGVRYILKGGVQKFHNKIRVTVTLIDGVTGEHAWAENYDRELDDIFEVQDDVAERIVGTLANVYGGRLRNAWKNQRIKASLPNFKAFDIFMRGIDRVDRFTKEDNFEGRKLMEQATKIEPGYAKAYGKIAWCYLLDASEGWCENYDEMLDLAYQNAIKCIELDDNEAWGHWALASYYIYHGEHENCQREYERALELNPNDADVLFDFGYFSIYWGLPANEGLAIAKKAMRLNPHHPKYYLLQLVQIYYEAGEFAQAITTYHSLHNIETTLCLLYLASSQSALGFSLDANKTVQRILELDPNASLAKWTAPGLAPYKNPNSLKRFSEHLKAAGLPH